MTTSRTEELHGEPHLHIGGLRLWIHGREREDAEDYGDGNWLVATAEYRSTASSTRVQGSFVRSEEIEELETGVRALHSALRGEATLACCEPQLRAMLRGDGLGHVELEVSITPDPARESHVYRDTIDQTYLPAIADECAAILERHPVRDRNRER